MENTKKSLSDSILELTKSAPDVSESISNTASKSAESATNAVTETGSGIFGFIASISWVTWLVIILTLAFLGFNIFSYLAQGTQNVSNVFAPLLKKILDLIYGTANQTIDVAAEGAKEVTTATATGVNTGLTAVQEVTPNTMKSSVSSTNYEENKEEIEESKNSLNKALNNSNKNNRNTGKDDEYEPNQASSSVHDTGKAGWCFIGEDRGYRTCSKVSENDKCMSGDIFPSQQLCINPSLRA